MIAPPPITRYIRKKPISDILFSLCFRFCIFKLCLIICMRINIWRAPPNPNHAHVWGGCTNLSGGWRAPPNPNESMVCAHVKMINVLWKTMKAV